MASIATAHAALKNVDQTAVFVFGSGACAKRVIKNLKSWGVSVQTSLPDPIVTSVEKDVKRSQDLQVEMLFCSGSPGAFKLRLLRDGRSTHRNFSALVVAEDDLILPNFNDYQLKPAPRILSISELENRLDQTPAERIFSPKDKVAFLNGLHQESHPVVTERMLALCHLIQAGAVAQTFFFTDNLKVAADGAEQLSAAAKANGAVFIKKGSRFPEIVDTQDGGVSIEYRDELTNLTFLLTADWVIVDETHLPSQRLGKIAEKLDLEKDPDGYLQSDNVHRISNATNRRGVFVAGGSRGILSRFAQEQDADQVALQVVAFLSDEECQGLPAAEIDQGRCARCLTCHRLCPHAAIEIDNGITIQSEACFSCGICVAGCPARAIDIHGLDVEQNLVRSLEESCQTDRHPCPSVRIVMFGCSRSAGSARDLCTAMGNPLPPEFTLVEVPCGGRVSSQDLLAAFDQGADGVMLCTCHNGNCKSEMGNQFARQRAQQVQKALRFAGIEEERLLITSIAANMGQEINQMVTEFSALVQGLPR